MTASIYEFVREKLATHGVNRTSDGRMVIENKLLFLSFVRLERAVRVSDFSAVQNAVDDIKQCVAALGKSHLIVFAYMYLYFSDGTAQEIKRADEENGNMILTYKYRRSVTKEDRLIADWGGMLYDKFGEDLLGLVYAS